MSTIIVYIFLAYFVFLITLVIGWKRVVKQDYSVGWPDDGPLISIIIPARNEEAGIGDLLDDISRQEHRNFQVIVVDDHSDDNTFDVASRHAHSDSRFRIIKSEGIGKKEALRRGIEAAAGSIIITTDADCRVNEKWVGGLTRYFYADWVKMVFGPVKLKGDGLFAEIQSLEFVSVVGAGAAASGLGVPFICNGANLAFRKSVFEAVDGYLGNLHIPSGDDEFLMRKVLKQFPGGVIFSADVNTVVTTLPKDSLKDFVQQRIRWAGKWNIQPSFSTVATAMLVFFFQVFFMSFPVLYFKHWVSLELGLLLVAGKFLIEFLFLSSVANHLQTSWNWLAFILLQLIYPLYAVAVGLMSNFSPFVWKGRKSGVRTSISP